MAEPRDLFSWSDSQGQYPGGVVLRQMPDGALRLIVRSPQRQEGDQGRIPCPGVAGGVTLPADALRELARRALAEV